MVNNNNDNENKVNTMLCNWNKKFNFNAGNFNLDDNALPPNITI